MRDKKYLLFIGILVFIVFIALSINAKSRTIYVDLNDPNAYHSIQQAIDNASDGDIIIVKDGIFVENIDINKPLTVKSENGPAKCVVQAKSSDDHVFEVVSNYVSISGFTIKGATGYQKAGIFLNTVKNCNISNNEVVGNYYGINLWSSSNNTLTNNTFF